MKWLAIANPAAGRGHEVRRLIDRLGRSPAVDAEVARTAAPGDATRFARESSTYEGVIVIGGDGTIAEVLQGLDLARQSLAVLPAGHGNCLARDLGVATADRAVEALARGATRPLDLMRTTIEHADGRSDDRLCASTLALGYVTDVVEFGRRRLHGLGRAAYAAAAMVVVPSEFDVRRSGAGGSPDLARRTGLVINNTAHLANFRGFPDASVHDGVIDVMEQACAWPRQMVHNLSVLAGSRAFGPLRLRQVQAEQVELCEPRTLMADGELLREVVRLRVECLPAVVSCVVGAP